MSASLPYRANADFLESKYIDWKKDPASVEPLWSSFFEGFELGMAKLAAQPAKGAEGTLSEKTLSFRMRVTNAMHHFRASATPPRISIRSARRGRTSPSLSLAGLGFTDDELEEDVQTHMFRGGQPMKLKTMLSELRRIYCGKTGFEFWHINNPEVRAWLLDRIEVTEARNRPRRSRSMPCAGCWRRKASSASCIAVSSGRSASPWKVASPCSWRWRPSSKACQPTAAKKSCWAWPTAAVSACWRISCASRWSSLLRVQRELCAKHGQRRWRREVSPRL
jgi:hypothetical protein